MKINTKGCIPHKKVNHGSLGLNAADHLVPLRSWCDVSVTIPKMNPWGLPWAEPFNILRALRRGLPPSSDPALGSLHSQTTPPTNAFSSLFPHQQTSSPLTSPPRAPRSQRGCLLALQFQAGSQDAWVLIPDPPQGHGSASSHTHRGPPQQGDAQHVLSLSCRLCSRGSRCRT